MSGEDYQDRFSQLQDNLHKRMERIAKLRNEQNQKPAKNEKVDYHENMFGVADDMSLTSDVVQKSLCDPEQCVYHSANESLHSEIRELKDETGRLRKFIAEKEYEIKQFNRKIEKLEQERLILAGQDAPAAAPTKIIELSKKNRDLNAILEGEKNKSVRLQQKVNELEMKLHNSQTTKSTKVSPSKEKEESASEQLQIINMKLIESRNQVQSLKQELKVAHKVLCQEIGVENLNISSLLKDPQGFRGRSMQIKALQTKIKDLERKMKGNEDNFNDKNFTRIKMVEKARKESVESMKNELLSTQSKLQESSKKQESLKSRNKVLAGEIKSLKSQVTMLTDKGKHDNELIDTLMNQQEKLQQMMENVTSKQTEAVQKEANTSKTLYEHDQQAAAEIALLKSLLEERDERVRELEGPSSNPAIRDSIELGRGRLSARKEKTAIMCSTGTNTDLTNELDKPENIKPDVNGRGDSNNMETRKLQVKCAELTAMLKAAETEKCKIAQINDQLAEREQKLSAELYKVVSSKEQTAIERSSSKTGDSTTRNLDSHSKLEDNFNQRLSLQVDENNALKETLRSVQEAHTEDCRIYKEMIKETKQVFLETLRGLVEGKVGSR